MRPRKTSEFHSFETLKSFVQEEGTTTRKVGPKIVLKLNEKQDDIVATYMYRNATRYWVAMFNCGGITINNRVPFVCRDEILDFINSFLVQFGCRMSRAIYGPKRIKNTWILKPLNGPTFGIESDFSATFLPPGDREQPWLISWHGKALNGETLSPEAREKAIRNSKARAKVGRERFIAAKTLGFIDATKLWGYKLPADKSPENLANLNAIAKGMGYASVAAAWAHDVNLQLDSSEHDLIAGGIAPLYGELMKGSGRGEINFERRYRFTGDED